ncbi:universal stress protein [Porphyromonas macacae]|uniref:Universal stress protein family n=1 Tax=Porphyromonas macacae TaxID=28115 RepID=A0A379DG40_9PORP|nr:universal stress protein [Porphyromonas macacae]SUB77306.1 Universal stress protein family [Porphyromonas macacae]
MNKDQKNEKDEIVTLAIHSFGEAQILKTMLESEGIPVQLANVNLIQPVVSAGVRVRINKKDLPHALSIIEQSHFSESAIADEKRAGAMKEESYVLIPVDFETMTEKICDMGIRYAARHKMSIVILHAHYNPFYPAPMFVGDVNTIPVADEVILRKTLEEVQGKMDTLKRQISEKMKSGALPKVEMKMMIRDGAPEEVIKGYSHRHRPNLIVMGSRSKEKKDADLIGSVAAEIMDSNRAPVLVVPEESHISDFSDAKEVAVATSFEQSDLVLFERYIQLFGHLNPRFHLFNISTNDRQWDEIQLNAIREYFKKQYPTRQIEVNMLDAGDFGTALDIFTTREKIDLIVVNTYKRNFLRKLIFPSKARRMLFYADTPLLVMPH